MSSTAIVAAFDLGCANQAAGKFSLLSPAQGAEIEELTSLIIPSDETPGAREAGVVWFIDATLAGAGLTREDIETQGEPLHSAISRLYPGRSTLPELTLEERHVVMAEIQETEFFEDIRYLTVTGLFAHPRHGGNRDKLGWKLLGFDDRHAWQPPFGHYDAEYTASGK